jgi:hypothetical protein
MLEWDARAWVASQVGCEPGDLSVAGQTRLRHGIDTEYERGGLHVGRLMLTRPSTEGTSGTYWIILLELAAGGDRQGPDDVSLAAAIGF